MSASGGTGDKDSTRNTIRQYARRFKAALRGGKANGTAANGSLPSPEEPLVRATNTPPPDFPPDAFQAAPTNSPARATKSGRMVPLHVEEDRAGRQAAKMKALFFKYEMDFEEDPWQAQTLGPGIRVEKRIRMRVQVRCHVCRSVYASSTGCPQCHHPRCDQCVRHPGRRKAPDTGDTEEEIDESSQRTGRRRRLSTATDGSGIFVEVGHDTDSAPRPPNSPERRRKRRVKPSTGTPSNGRGSSQAELSQTESLRCCVCQGFFVRNFTPCLRCKHRRCKECPQNASNADLDVCNCQESVVDTKRNSDGPGVSSKGCKTPHDQGRWTCHKCHTPFLQGNGQCSCGHRGCDQCLRVPPKRARHQVYLHPESARVSESSSRISVNDSLGTGSQMGDSESSSGGLFIPRGGL